MRWPLTNSAQRYGAIAALFHWAMAALILGLAAVAIYMVRLPDVGFDRTKITLILGHKATGILALALVVVRIAWRTANPLPPLADSLPAWQQVTARTAHLLLYALMLAMPLTGWLMSSAGGYPTSFFGWFVLPDLIPVNEHLFHRLITLHTALGYTLLALVAVHVAAALAHHFVLRDDTLRKMLP